MNEQSITAMSSTSTKDTATTVADTTTHDVAAPTATVQQPPRVDRVVPVASTKWIALQTLEWTDQEGKSRFWDMATRTTKNTTQASTADAVIIIPLLRYLNPVKGGDSAATTTAATAAVETVLVQQYRPPVQQRTIEFPAGLIDVDETIEQAALRELREETGYIGEACSIKPIVSRPVCMSPGLCNETVHIVTVVVDLNNPYNFGTPVPQCDEGEHTTVIRVSLQDGMQTLLDNQTSTPMPLAGLYMFALGYELGRQQQQQEQQR